MALPSAPAAVALRDLRDAGVGVGDRLAVLDLNHRAAVELTLAGSALRAATVPVNFRLSLDQIRYVLEDSWERAI